MSSNCSSGCRTFIVQNWNSMGMAYIQVENPRLTRRNDVCIRAIRVQTRRPIKNLTTLQNSIRKRLLSPAGIESKPTYSK